MGNIDDNTYKQLNVNLFPIKDGKYYIHSTIDNRYVWDMDSNSSNLQLWEKHGGANQQFIFKSDGVAKYRIYCAQNGKAVDCQGSNESNGANVWLYPYNDTSAQHWHLKGQGLLNFSAYSGINPLKNRRCIDVPSSNVHNGASLWLYHENNTNAQIWLAEPC